MAWRFILALVVLLLCLLLFSSVKLSLCYRNKFTMTMRVFGIPIPLIGGKSRKDKEAGSDSKKKQKSQKKKHTSPLQNADKGKLVTEVCTRLQELFEKYGKIFRHIRIQKLNFYMTVATEDSAATGILYGTVCAAASSLYALLQRMRKGKYVRVKIDADFLAQTSSVDLDAEIAIRFLYLWAAVWILWREYQKLIQRTKQEKDGVKHE